jgi:hypothetical protein
MSPTFDASGWRMRRTSEANGSISEKASGLRPRGRNATHAAETPEKMWM